MLPIHLQNCNTQTYQNALETCSKESSPLARNLFSVVCVQQKFQLQVEGVYFCMYERANRQVSSQTNFNSMMVTHSHYNNDEEHCVQCNAEIGDGDDGDDDDVAVAVTVTVDV